MAEFFAYILVNQSKTKRYKGHTSDLTKRLIEHNQGHTRTTRGDIWSVEHFEKFDTREEAILREKYFKTAAGRRWIQKNVGK